MVGKKEKTETKFTCRPIHFKVVTFLSLNQQQQNLYMTHTNVFENGQYNLYSSLVQLVGPPTPYLGPIYSSFFFFFIYFAIIIDVLFFTPQLPFPTSPLPFKKKKEKET